ncbi:unnamed protein product [Notodromas monacha]|uniref:Coiled-coil domain-containing protein 130 n=1 Tax=Notodromas monacha TaxID=399045 RepID=A0A7R9BL75_9CRUS|nr:unnamed protein product [Notodromas monacha]CAG0917532.1 unnamed protein product [Notodromas monacha]
MGERKGTNKWYPPDWHPDMGGLDKYYGTHPLRERAKKIGQGIIVIRFEMPYNIWCGGCGNHIGMGVRYNAEKKKVGNYYSTTIWQFRMKCHLCDNYFEIKTDPANLDYEIVSGARRQERRFDPKQNGQVVPEDRDTIKKLATDPMFKLEHVEKDKRKSKEAKETLGNLEGFQYQRWKDDYAANRLMRDKFRESKKELARGEAADNEVLKRASLELKLLPETVEDKKLAHRLANSSQLSYEEVERGKLEALRRQSVFAKNKQKSVEANVARKVLKQTILAGSKSVSGAVPKTSLSVASKRNSAGIILKPRVECIGIPSTSSPSCPIKDIGSAETLASSSSSCTSVTTNGEETSGLSLIADDYGSDSSDET